VPGFIGLAIGRTIWHQPLENWLARKLDRGAATRAIADNYLRMIDVYQDARGRLAAVDLASDRGL